MLISHGVNFFHTQVEDVLKELLHISSYYQVTATRTGSMDKVEVSNELDEFYMHTLGLSEITEESVVQHESLRQLRGECIKKIKDNIGLSMDVKLVAYGALPRSEGGKLSRIKDLRTVYS
ncbi:hypothetical protein PKOR_14535 [Pontibacter korlensis]|uniref:AMP-dependent ligase C-terminal domain-containing protein n=2 Tax=Pontibacter korlensis TaxID=400092 RepID=A0A0E3ZF47_9BACT|nr:hypothetical protein PKOR_14535 [Pontibacter korlensis]